MAILAKLFKSINIELDHVHPRKKQQVKMPTQQPIKQQPQQPQTTVTTHLKMDTEASQPHHSEVDSIVQQVKSLSLADTKPIVVVSSSSSPIKVQQVGPMSKPLQKKKKPNLHVNTEKSSSNKRTVPPYAISLPRKYHASEQLPGDVIRNVFMQWISTTEYSKFYEKYQ
ncbi:hypothetical protein FDP41_006954 [Naegleria fowleri]|uniref:Uncharacterized protein n=1 Tax=Naegleria fowleri TaxID=5763 RepID=A0A6A5B5Z8_NAEFO|nr:uncharacterized protein FDP41_006954 [Naegleria fowleri]KAF0974023.1 hypothetical protein FDP41_006954 [Naegleria fowleri]CAG4718658.1 unnamed protein product [Naegleria fowleri]